MVGARADTQQLKKEGYFRYKTYWVRVIRAPGDAQAFMGVGRKDDVQSLETEHFRGTGGLAKARRAILALVDKDIEEGGTDAREGND